MRTSEIITWIVPRVSMVQHQCETIACPLCGAASTSVREFETALYTLRPGERIVSCEVCQFVFLNPRTPAEVMQREWYDSEEYYAYYEQSCGTVGYQHGDAAPHLKKRLERIEQLRGGAGRLLDVGSGKGYFLAHAQRRGWDVQGVEISAFGTEFASQHLGVPVVRGTLEQAAFPSGSFDVLHMNHVLEHLYDLPSFFAEVRRVLRPDGWFIVEVPNQIEHLGYVLRRQFAPALLRANKDGEVNFHTSFFTKRSIARMFRSNGFEPVIVEARTWIPSVSSRSTLGRWMKYALWAFENLIGQGENIVVFAVPAPRPGKD